MQHYYLKDFQTCQQVETMFIKTSIIDSKILANVIDLLGKAEILRDGQSMVNLICVTSLTLAMPGNQGLHSHAIYLVVSLSTMILLFCGTASKSPFSTVLMTHGLLG